MTEIGAGPQALFTRPSPSRPGGRNPAACVTRTAALRASFPWRAARSVQLGRCCLLATASSHDQEADNGDPADPQEAVSIGAALFAELTAQRLLMASDQRAAIVGTVGRRSTDWQDPQDNGRHQGDDTDGPKDPSVTFPKALLQRVPSSCRFGTRPIPPSFTLLTPRRQPGYAPAVGTPLGLR